MKNQYNNPVTVLSFLLPSLAGFVLFILGPILYTAVLSFTNYSGGMTFKFIGLKNYLRAFGNANFHRALKVTVQFVIASVTLQLIFGLLYALILNGPRRGRGFFRGIIVLPTVLSSVAISLSFMLLMHPEHGMINEFLRWVGFTSVPPWLAGTKTALLSIVIVFLWQTFGYYMIIFLSGLQSISPVLYEAAELDGAGSWRKFYNITLPMLSPVMFLCVILAVIKAFQVYEQVYVMTGGNTGGGPAGATSVLVFDIYLNAFAHYKFGYASAEAMILLVIVLAITAIQYRGQNKWVSYDVS